MSKLVKKLLVSILLSLYLVLNVVPTAHAQASPSPWFLQGFGEWYAKVYDSSNPTEIFGERYTAAQVQWVIYGLLSFSINTALGGNMDLGKCIFSTGATGDVTPCIDAMTGFVKKVTAATPQTPNLTKTDTVGNIATSIFADRPFSGITYVKELGRKFHIIPEAQAQGFGYQNGLGVVPEIQQIWSSVRNVAYTLFVIIVMVMAFMIMFRIKISPQVVITIQSALPKIAITILLVTFSYAIAGFLIDLMYVVIGLISLIFSQFQVAGINIVGVDHTQGYFDMLTKGPAFLGGGAGVLGFLLLYWVNFILIFLLVVIIGLIGGLCGGGGGLGGSLMAGLTFIIGVIALLVLLIIMLVNFFKIIWLLARTFLSIILLVVFAPLQLTLGAVVPGFGFGSWVKSLVSKLAVFPGVGVMFLLALLFLEMAWGAVEHMGCNLQGLMQGVVSSGAAPVTGLSFPAGWPPLMGGSPQAVALLFLVASMGVFAMIPSVGGMVEAMIAGKQFNYGSAIGEGFGPAKGLGLTGLGIVTTPQEEAAKAAGVSPYAYGTTKDKAKYALAQLTKLIVNGK